MGVRERAVVVAVVAVLLFALSVPAASAVSYDEPQATVYTIDVAEDGDATWTVELRYQLIGSQDTDAFEEIIQDFEEGELVIFEGIEEDMQPLVEEASDETDREMSLSGFEREMYIEDSPIETVGHAKVEFVWDGFAEVDDGDVYVGDVFVGTGLAMAGNERLIIGYPDGLDAFEISPGPDLDDGDRLIWDGERFFEEGNPSVIFSDNYVDDEDGTNGDNTSDGTNGDGDNNQSGDAPPSPATAVVLAGFLVLATGFAGGVYLGRKTGVLETGDEGTKIATEDMSGDDAEEIEVQNEILTDEDRIVALLRENGGRMKQADIVDETDWSKSKVSMVLSDMEDEGRISKLRLGRENVIDLEDGDDDTQDG